MTADYNGWNDAPETEREAMDVYSRQESERESLEDVMAPVFEQTIIRAQPPHKLWRIV